jgi:hypothetical protein
VADAGDHRVVVVLCLAAGPQHAWHEPPRETPMPNKDPENAWAFPWLRPATLFRCTAAARASGPSWLAHAPSALEACSASEACTVWWP